ncbi:MAG: transposase family protein [Dehalococcoidia bacterium]|nr:transposase family protein [Dehalococcoidia bacterium]
MQDDVITVQLRLPELVVLGVKERKGWIEVVARYRREEAVCPRCGLGTWHVQRKRDAKIWGKEVWLVLWKRRFRCRVCRKVFTEPDPRLVGAGRGRRGDYARRWPTRPTRRA